MRALSPSRRRISFGAGAILLATLLNVQSTLAATQDSAWDIEGADPRRAPELIAAAGCGGCHAIPGIPHADGNVGPPLSRFGSRTYVAGMLVNNPTNLIAWLRFPQSVVPGNAMPDMGLTESQARDIAAFLYTLK